LKMRLRRLSKLDAPKQPKLNKNGNAGIKREMRGWRAIEKVILGMTLEFWGGARSWKIG
jgi:hypothetical protein